MQALETRLLPLILHRGERAVMYAVVATLLELMRDAYVAERGLSWITMPDSQRRLVYSALVDRLFRHLPLSDCEALDQREKEKLVVALSVTLR